MEYFDDLFNEEILILDNLRIFFSFDKEQVYQILRYVNNIDNDGVKDLGSVTIWLLKNDNFRIFKNDTEYIRKLCNLLMLTSLMSIEYDNNYVITQMGRKYLNRYI